MPSLKLLLPFILAVMSMNIAVVSSVLTTNTNKESGSTWVKAEHLTYDWTVRNSSLLPHGMHDIIYSPIFHNENNDVQWKLKLDRYDSTTFVELCLHYQKGAVINATVHYTMSILKSNIVKVTRTHDYTYTYTDHCGVWTYISRSDLLDPLGFDDTIVIPVEIDGPNKIVAGPSNITDPSNIQHPASKEPGSTWVEAEHLTYDWTVRNLLSHEKYDIIYSPIFHNESNDMQWKLKLTYDAYYTHVALCFHSQKDAVMETRVHYTMSILKSNIAKVNRMHDYRYTYTGDCSVRTSILTSDLLDGLDDTIVIRVEIYGPNKIVAGPSNVTNPSHVMDPPNITDPSNIQHPPYNITDPLEQALLHELEKGRLNEQFAQLFKDPKFTDVIVVVSNETFLAHKTILAIRSPVFAAMFQNEQCNANRTNEVRIEDMEPMVGKAMLEFLYSDNVTDLETLASGLIEAADRFQLSRLRIMCEIVLYKTFNVNNAADFLIHADLYHSTRLKEHIMKFIVNHLAAVKKTKGYGRMKKVYPQLLIEVLEAANKDL